MNANIRKMFKAYTKSDLSRPSLTKVGNFYSLYLTSLNIFLANVCVPDLFQNDAFKLMSANCCLKYKLS